MEFSCLSLRATGRREFLCLSLPATLRKEGISCFACHFLLPDGENFRTYSFLQRKEEISVIAFHFLQPDPCILYFRDCKFLQPKEGISVPVISCTCACHIVQPIGGDFRFLHFLQLEGGDFRAM
jgi:hypothetical protein